MKDPITLFHYWRSSSSVRVRWALAIKGLQFESVHLDLLSGEHQDAAHAARSPLGYVPALRIGNHLISESVAICELLDDLVPSPPLRPADPYARARMRQLVEIVNAGTQPLQNLTAMRRVSPSVDEQRVWARHWITRGLAAFEAALHACRNEGHSGAYCVGDQLSLADLFLVPQLYNARRFDVDLAAFPLSLQVEANAITSESYREARAEAWQPAAAR